MGCNARPLVDYRVGKLAPPPWTRRGAACKRRQLGTQLFQNGTPGSQDYLTGNGDSFRIQGPPPPLLGNQAPKKISAESRRHG